MQRTLLIFNSDPLTLDSLLIKSQMQIKKHKNEPCLRHSGSSSPASGRIEIAASLSDDIVDRLDLKSKELPMPPPLLNDVGGGHRSVPPLPEHTEIAPSPLLFLLEIEITEVCRLECGDGTVFAIAEQALAVTQWFSFFAMKKLELVWSR